MNKNWWRQFFAENLLMSVCGHLLLVAILVTSVAVFVERAKLVAPDRIQIIEIDLDNVVVAGDETKLRNMDAPTDKKTEEKKPEKIEAKPVEQTPEKKEIDKTTLVEEEKKEEDKPQQQEEPAKPVEKKTVPAPKKKQVIRVNREVLSLDRTLTVSVVDALRVALTRCWNVDTTRPDIADIRAVAHLTMRENGTIANLWFESQARADTDPAFAYVLDTIRAAISVCQPFRMLPENEFESWEKIQLTFYPTQGKVM